jgi:hypothetical protein
MKKRIGKKLSLHRESLRLLTNPDALRQAMGGEAGTVGPNSSRIDSIVDCVSCARNPDTE